MPQLISLKDEIDKGKTAKLLIGHERSSTSFTIRVKRVKHEDLDCYAWQHFTAGHMVYPTENPLTDLHPTWEQLLETIKGEQLETSGWQLCNDPLMDYLPPERKQAP